MQRTERELRERMEKRQAVKADRTAGRHDG
jgi:hypothetical protein